MLKEVREDYPKAEESRIKFGFLPRLSTFFVGLAAIVGRDLKGTL